MTKYTKQIFAINKKKQKFLIELCNIIEKNNKYYLYNSGILITEIMLKTKDNNFDSEIFTFQIQQKKYKYDNNQNKFNYIGEEK